MITVLTNISLDGVMQAPGRSDEDTRGGFQHGGWATPYQAMQHAGAAFGNIVGLLLGRRTYQDFYAVWPTRPESPYTAFLNNINKYVVSTTLKEPLPWQNSTRLDSADAVANMARLRLVNKYIMLIHPLLLGTGRRLFPEGGPYAVLTLTDSIKTEHGVVMATYVPAP
jgi:dihydrofolate reductase